MTFFYYSTFFGESCLAGEVGESGGRLNERKKT